MQQRYSDEQVEQVVSTVVAPLTTFGSVITLTGPLGAGKTTLVRALLRQLGVTGSIPSPTFTYVNTYQFDQGAIHHFDLYRIGSVNEFCEAGFEELIADKNGISIIEWPDVITPILARHNKVVSLAIEYDPACHDVRVLTVR